MLNKAEHSPPEDDDDWEERFADPWNMTAKELNRMFYQILLPLILIVLLSSGFVLYSEVTKNAEKHKQNRPAPPFTWPPPETYDSSSLKR